jgi:hypothetical protein
MKFIIAVLVISALAGCAVMTKPKDSQTVIYSNVCILAMCETADEISRVGDPQSEGDVDEAVQESKDTDQGQEGNLSVPVSGATVPTAPAGIDMLTGNKDGDE